MRTTKLYPFVCVALLVTAGCGGGGGNDTRAGDSPALIFLPPDPPAAAPSAFNTLFAGPRSNYSINRAFGFTVIDRVGLEGSRSMSTPTTLRFSDVNVAFGSDSTAAKVYRLYQAAFDRTPDAAGLGYQIDALDRVGLRLDQVAANFAASPEFSSKYGNLNDTQFITLLYQNVLHRAPDAGGLQFHLSALASGNTSRPQLLANFSESPENQSQLAQVIAAGVHYIPLNAPYGTVFGTVAVGAPVEGADVSVFDEAGIFGTGTTDANGNFSVSSLLRGYIFPIRVKAGFTVAGRKISLFSVSLEDNTFGNMRINVTPYTDMITRIVVPAPKLADPMASLYEERSKLPTALTSVKKVLGALLPAGTIDFMRQPLVANPQVSETDALLERVAIGIVADDVVLIDRTGRQLAKVPVAAMANGTVGSSDTETITDSEAAGAIAARGAFPTVTASVKNEASSTEPLPALAAHDLILETPSGKSITYTLPDSGAETYALKTQPSHGTLVLNSSSTGSFTYQPAAGFVGQDSFTFVVARNTSSGVEVSLPGTVTIQVLPGVVIPTVTKTASCQQWFSALAAVGTWRLTYIRSIDKIGPPAKETTLRFFGTNEYEWTNPDSVNIGSATGKFLLDDKVFGSEYCRFYFGNGMGGVVFFPDSLANGELRVKLSSDPLSTTYWLLQAN